MYTLPTKTADLREELAVALGRAKEAEALLERGRADLDRLEDGQRRAQTALDAKNQEVPTIQYPVYNKYPVGRRPRKA